MLPKIPMAGVALSSLLFTSSGCAASNRTRPEDMTVAEHREAARKDASASERASRSARAGGRSALSNRMLAESLSSRSAEHAAAADARVKQVSDLCQGTESIPALEAASITSIQPIVEADAPRSRGYLPVSLKGARIFTWAPAGLPADSLAAALRCEAARAGSGLDADSRSPLTVNTASSTVIQKGSRVVLEVRSKDVRAAEEIVRRARLLASARQ